MSYQVLTRTAPAHGIQHSEKLSTPGSELMFVKQKMRLAVAVAHIAGLVEYQHEERLVQLRSSCMKFVQPSGQSLPGEMGRFVKVFMKRGVASLIDKAQGWRRTVHSDFVIGMT
jgi:hypothetical protein